MVTSELHSDKTVPKTAAMLKSLKELTLENENYISLKQLPIKKPGNHVVQLLNQVW